MRPQRIGWWLAACAALALGVRIWRIGEQGYWEDEVYSLNVAIRPLRGVLSDHDQTPPLYVLLLHFWTSALGVEEGRVRLLSAFFGTGAALLAFPLTRRVAGPGWSIVATALAGLSLYGIIVAQDARTYSLLMLLVGASLLALLRWIEIPTRARLTAWVLVTVLLLYSHVYGLFFVAAQAIYFLWAGRKRLPLRDWWIAQVAVGLAFGPWLGILLQRTQHVATGFWLWTPTLADLGWTAVVLAGSRLLAIVFAALLVVLAWRLLRGASPGWRQLNESKEAPLVLFGLAVALPVAVPFVVSQWLPIFLAKYCIGAAVPLAVLVTASMARLPRHFGRVVAVAAVAGSLVAVGGYYASDMGADSKRDWRGAAEMIDAEAGPGAVVLFNTGYCESDVDTDLQCAFSWYSTRADLELVPFLESGPVTQEEIPLLESHLANATDVWLIYGYITDTERRIPAGIEALGFESAGAWTPKGLEVLRFQISMTGDAVTA